MLKIGVCSKKKICQFIFLANYNRFKHVKVSTTKSHIVQCERKICAGSVTQAGRHAETRKSVDIYYKSASVACARATGAGQTVCDAGRQDAETRKRVDIYKSVGY